MKGLYLFKKYAPSALILALIALGAWFRLIAYGDINNSIGTLDTYAYLEMEKIPFLSTSFLFGERPPTVPLLYKILEPAGGYHFFQISSPTGAESPKVRDFQEGFDRVVQTQTFLSIIGWSLLAWTLSRHLKNPIARVATALLVLAFAYSPQLAEWDSILMSESLSFSLLALLLALTVELAYRLLEQSHHHSRLTYVLSFGWILILTLWVLTRDTNSYVIPLTLAFIAGLFLIPKTRRHIPKIYFAVIALVLIGLFVYQQNSLFRSYRYRLPLICGLTKHVFPYDYRIQYFKERGMPTPVDVSKLTEYWDSLPALLPNQEFMNWVYTVGPATYSRFLLDHPLWAGLTFFRDLQNLYSENLQPYFIDFSKERTDTYLMIGDLLHPKASGVILLNFLLSAAIIGFWFKTRDSWWAGWALIAAWWFLAAALLQFFSYFGDPRSIIRHALAGAVPFRFGVWFLSLILLDGVLHTSMHKRESA